MAYDSACVLDQVNSSVTQHEVTANGVLKALSEAALFGIRRSKTQGLALTLYGGNLPTISGSIVQVPETLIRLTASATNYISVSDGGTISVVTAAPAGWPGPFTAGQRALYSIVTDANGITGGTNYVEGGVSPGPAGPVGNQGPAGAELYLQRRSVYEVVGYGTSSVTTGFNIAQADPNSIQSSNSVTQDANDFSLCNGHVRYVTGNGSTNTSNAVYAKTNRWFLGNAAGRGGFDITIRFGLDITFSNNNTHMRALFGVWNIDSGAPSASADPSSFINFFGVAADDADTNFQFMVNDGSGSATKTDLGANFPKIVLTNRIYELRLWSVGNSGVINYAHTDLGSGNVASGTASSNIPANTQFFDWMCWINTGSSTNNTGFTICQVAANKYMG